MEGWELKAEGLTRSPRLRLQYPNDSGQHWALAECRPPKNTVLGNADTAAEGRSKIINCSTMWHLHYRI
jgi:hypothetical protein